MTGVSSLSFGEKTFLGTQVFASCRESNNGGDNFMGPTLWPADLDVFANVNQDYFPGAVCAPYLRQRPLTGLLGSHIDMLHQSPYCMGIAHDIGNAYWTFDGFNGHLVRYDFVRDHGPGHDDHSDGRVRRYRDVPLRRVAGVPGHMIVDSTTGLLYVADTGTGRVLRIDTSTASESSWLMPRNEPLDEFVTYTGSTVSVVASGLMQPSGIAIHENRLFVSDHATGRIVAYALDSGTELARLDTGARAIMGLTFSPNGLLWYVDGSSNRVVRVDHD